MRVCDEEAPLDLSPVRREEPPALLAVSPVPRQGRAPASPRPRAPLGGSAALTELAQTPRRIAAVEAIAGGTERIHPVAAGVDLALDPHVVGRDEADLAVA